MKSPLILIISTLLACGSVEDKVRENADIQAEVIVEKERNERHRRSKKMEQDLQVVRSLFTAINGNFKGIFFAEKKVMVRADFHIIAHLKPLKTNRIRSEKEISDELNALALSVEVRYVFENAVNFSCKFGNVIPNYSTGVLDLTSENCPLSFRLWPKSRDSLNPRFDLDASETFTSKIISSGEAIYSIGVQTRSQFMEKIFWYQINRNTN